MKLSDKIRIIRKARGLSQEGLGNSLSRVNKYGISRQTVSDWENGNTEPILENIRDLAEVLNVSFDALLDETIDLNDQEVLNRVLKNTSKTVKQSVNSSFSYSIHAHKKKTKLLWLTIVGGLLTVASICAVIIGIFLLASGQDGIGLFLMIPGFVIGAPVIATFVGNLINLLIKSKGTYIGTLNSEYLILHTKNEAENTLYIPLEKIEGFERANKTTKKHDDVIVRVVNRARPVTILDVENVDKLIEIYNKVGSYIEDSDGIKIL